MFARKLKYILTFVCVSPLVAGCVLPQAKTNVDNGYHGHPKRVLIVNDLGKRLRGKDIENFQAAAMQAYAACGVAAELQTFDELSLAHEGDDRLQIRAMATQAKADAVVFYSIAGYTTRNGMDQSVTVQVLMKDIVSDKAVWRTKFDVVPSSWLFVSRAGEKIGGDVVKRMAADGVIRTCPAAA